MPSRPGAIAGLLLTGGASRRMGADKALIEVGRPAPRRPGRGVLTAVADPVLEVGPGGRGCRPCGRTRRERAAGRARAGAAALRAAGHDGPVLVLAVDMPRVGVELLRLLAGRPGPARRCPGPAGIPSRCAPATGPHVLAAVDERLAAGGDVAAGPAGDPRNAVGRVGWVEPRSGSRWPVRRRSPTSTRLRTSGVSGRLRRGHDGGDGLAAHLPVARLAGAHFTIDG